MLVVAKFGGTSCADSLQFIKVQKIINEDLCRQVIVVSALGKRHKEDHKITDLLYLLSAHIKYGVNADHLWQEIFNRYNSIKIDLGLNINLNTEFAKIKEDISKNFDEAYLVSRGEYLSAKLMAAYLGYKFIDASKLFYFDYNGLIDFHLTDEAIIKSIRPGDRVVVPGFYGKNPNGMIKLFSRGGSDITGSLLARALKATKYENWTDVSGILVADPKLITAPKRIDVINYDELRELSYMGASIIHEETILPIADLDIPIYILNTNAPNEAGTIISKDAINKDNLITGIAGKKNYLSLNIVKEKQADKLEVLIKVLEVLKAYHVGIENLPTSIDSFSLILENKKVSDKLMQVIGDIRKINDIIDVSVDNDMALIAIVGRNMVLRPGISGRIFSILGSADINIKMIAQGAKEFTIILGVSNQNYEKAIKVIYNELVM